MKGFDGNEKRCHPLNPIAQEGAKGPKEIEEGNFSF